MDTGRAVHGHVELVLFATEHSTVRMRFLRTITHLQAARHTWIHPYGLRERWCTLLTWVSKPARGLISRRSAHEITVADN